MTGSSCDLRKAALLTISSLSSRVVAWLPSMSISARVVEDIHGVVYQSAVQHLFESSSYCPPVLVLSSAPAVAFS